MSFARLMALPEQIGLSLGGAVRIAKLFRYRLLPTQEELQKDVGTEWSKSTDGIFGRDACSSA